MKRFFTVLATLLMSFSFFGINTAYAEENTQPTDALYLDTAQVSQSEIDYFNSEKITIVQELNNIGIVFQNVEQSLRVTFGQPFKLGEVTTFPVLYRDDIIALAEVLQQENGYAWMLSVDYANELNGLKVKTDLNHPAILSVQSGNVYATTEDDLVALTDLDIAPDINFEPELKGNVVNLLEPSDPNGFSVQDILYQDRAACSKYLYLDLKETQGQQSWCAVFATAQILRYRGKGDIRAQQIMKYFFPNSSDLTKEVLSDANAIKYANKVKSYPTRVTSTLSDSVVRSQIDQGKPIYLNCAGKDTYKKARHALVLRGYNDSTYSVWNPWKASYASMSKNTKSLPVSGGAFVWEITIYNW